MQIAAKAGAFIFSIRLVKVRGGKDDRDLHSKPCYRGVIPVQAIHVECIAGLETLDPLDQTRLTGGKEKVAGN